MSAASEAARAVVELLSLDLGPRPAFFGVHWDREFSEIPVFTRHGFKFPKDAVVILVGMKPIENALTPPPPPPNGGNP
jgi:hypothetical protein